jgi:hypothetical protein
MRYTLACQQYRERAKGKGDKQSQRNQYEAKPFAERGGHRRGLSKNIGQST